MNADKHFESGEMNDAIKGLFIQAGINAGSSREQIDSLLHGFSEAVEHTDYIAAKEIYRRYIESGILPENV